MGEHISTESWRPHRRPETIDPQIKRIGMAAAGFAGLLVVGFGGYALIGHHSHTIPVVEAPSGPVRVRPDNPGGMQIVGANEQILGRGDSGETDTTMAPPPEVPQPQALRAEIAAAGDDATPAQTVSPASPPPAAPSPAVASMVPPPPAPVQPAPRTATASPPERAAAPAVVTQAPAGRTQVQLAAVDSAQAAMTEWDRLSKRMPDLLRQHHPDVQRAEHDGKTFFRLRTGGFADIASATAFCEQVHSKGGGCSIASF